MIKQSIGALLLVCGCAGGDGEETPSGECSLQPGDYSVEYLVVSDGCDTGPLPSELVIIGPSGTVAGSTEPPDGCVDSGFVSDGCAVAFSRDCLVPTAAGDLEAEVYFSFNFRSGRGSVSGSFLLIQSGVALDGCSFSQRAEITRLR